MRSPCAPAIQGPPPYLAAPHAMLTTFFILTRLLWAASVHLQCSCLLLGIITAEVTRSRDTPPGERSRKEADRNQENLRAP
ncbi:hypothetical protein E2C01_072314 [Portunus trituberculatus]|uniref:Uncharacterized protein n=1 Tax=Portunus trituberculatus TaxID=210409 RepID=A0A5B7I7D9_PORTR|nr:hypothetical protein [Portunus trituberculatus]